MTVLETQYKGGYDVQSECAFCNEEPENGVLIEKPHSMIVNNQCILMSRPAPLYICLECLTFEIENM